jgi:hypothetical protein
MEWGPAQKKSFEDLKLYLQQLPTLSSPKQRQPLILYVSATHVAISGVLVVEKEITRDGNTVKQ